MSSNDEKDGFVDTLAKKLFASESSPLSSFADQQRAERLAACRQLEDIVNACQAQSKSQNTDELTHETEVVTTNSGTKIARFFKWGDRSVGESVGDNSESNGVKSKYSYGCHKEIHELWACRALALGCGNYLKDLRRVMDEDIEITMQKESSTDTKSEITYYEKQNSAREKETREIQQMMAKCVTKNASELAERIEARRNKK